MTVSLMSFWNYLPYIFVSLFAGGFVDGHSKKGILLATDSAAAACTAGILFLSLGHRLRIWHIYFVNFVIGFMNAFQQPAFAVAMGKILPRERLKQASGMNSFQSNLVAVLSPVLGAAIFGFGGLGLILAADLLSFGFAFLVLIFVLKIPEDSCKGERPHILSGCAEGFRYLKRDRGLWTIVMTMALINFFSRLTYENILSPMVLARGGNDSLTLGLVNRAVGTGGIIGGLLVSSGKINAKSTQMIYISAGLSFLLGDLAMGLGRNGFEWALAGFAASFPAPFIYAGQAEILYRRVPREIQGRIFALRNAIQFSTIPAGILLGGFWADRVFEPFMKSGRPLALFLQSLVGRGDGAGMAVMFLCTGAIGSSFCFAAYRQKAIQEIDR